MVESNYGGFQIPIEVKYINDIKQNGIFTKEFIQKDKLIWLPTLVKRYSIEEAKTFLSSMSNESAKVWLRQAFIYPTDLSSLCINVDDPGRYMNHSNDPNCGYANELCPCVALKDIEKGEELTCNYSGLGNPQWYIDLCHQYNVHTTYEVTMLYSE